MKKGFLGAFKAIWWFVVVPTYAGCVALPVRSNQTCLVVVLIIKAIFVWPWKMVSVSVRYLFHQPMDEKTKTWTLCFPAKENPNTERTLFDWPIMLQYDIKVKYRLISRKFSGMKFFHASIRLTNQKPCAFVSVRWTNHSFSIWLSFLFCLHIFISRSNKNCSNYYDILHCTCSIKMVKQYSVKWPKVYRKKL